MSELPEVNCNLKNHGRTYGTINVKPDGTFSGYIADHYAHDLIVSMLQYGNADGLTLSFHAVPAVPLTEHKTEPIPPSVAKRQQRIYSALMRNTREVTDDILYGETPSNFTFDIQNPDWDGR